MTSLLRWPGVLCSLSLSAALLQAKGPGHEQPCTPPLPEAIAPVCLGMPLEAVRRHRPEVATLGSVFSPAPGPVQKHSQAAPKEVAGDPILFEELSDTTSFRFSAAQYTFSDRRLAAVTLQMFLSQDAVRRRIEILALMRGVWGEGYKRTLYVTRLGAASLRIPAIVWSRGPHLITLQFSSADKKPGPRPYAAVDIRDTRLVKSTDAGTEEITEGAELTRIFADLGLDDDSPRRNEPVAPRRAHGD